MSFDPRLLDGILVCPRSKSALLRDGEALVSIDPNCRLRYEIKDGIPNMLLEEATEMPLEAWTELMQRLSQTVAPAAMAAPSA